MGKITIMMIKGGCLAAAALVSCPVLAAAEDKAVVLPPVTKWNVDYGDEKCRLARIFGEGENRTLLSIEQHGPAKTFSMSIAGQPMAAASRAKALDLRFGTLPVHEGTEFLSGTVEGIGKALFFSSMRLSPDADAEPANDEDDELEAALPTIELSSAEQATSIVVEYRDRSVILQTGGLSSPLKALNKCTVDLLEHWGLDPVRHGTLTRMPHWTNRREVVKRIVDTYPSNALASGQQGVFSMRVLVDETGQVTQCIVLDATINESLDSPACKAMKQARFAPALDQSGAAMPSFYITRIVYRIG